MTTPTFDTIEAQASYGIGLQVGQQLSESGLEGLLPEALVAGIADALEGKHPAVPVDVVHRALREIHERADAVRRQRFQAMAAEGVKYLEENAKKEGVNSTESGLQFRVINQGEGAIPARTDRVRVHYTGKLIDGTVFDSSVARGEPAEFPVNGVIPGWIEALTLMPVGSKWELTIPQELAYGERGAGASIPLTGFGHALTNGVKKAVQEIGLLGAFTGGLTSTAAGIAAAVFFGTLTALLFKPHPKE